MANLGRTIIVTRPIATGMVFTIRISQTVWLTPGQDVVLVRVVTAAGRHPSLLVQHGFLGQVVLVVQGVEVGGHDVAGDVLPLSLIHISEPTRPY